MLRMARIATPSAAYLCFAVSLCPTLKLLELSYKIKDTLPVRLLAVT